MKPEADLLPQSNEENFRFRQRQSYLQSEIEPYLWLIDQATRLNHLYPWPAGTDEMVLARLKANVEPVFDWLDNESYQLSGRFTVLDIYAYHLLSWVQDKGIVLPTQAERYLEGLAARPAFPLMMKTPS